jgi:16S rRNA (cytidine1402-2'-O)-methyltransferase
MGKLFVAATPIGNLGDLSGRALKIISSADLILAEDTRVTQKILNNFNISVPIKRYNEHNPEKTFEYLKNILSDNKSIVLVSDSGTPGISDPGGKLVDFVRNNLPKTDIFVIPGSSAVIAALSVSGMPANEFTFLGFVPAKNKRKKFFEKVKNIEVRPVVIYESPHRFLKTLGELKEELGGNREVFIAREMTKIYEEYFKGSLEEAIFYFEEHTVKGEFVIIVK